jgi:hypothetical protein
MPNLINSTTAANAANIPSLLRAQQAGIVGLKSNAKAVQSIIDQLQKAPGSNGSTATGKALSVAFAPPAASTPNLPRGSLVDVLA